MESTIGLKDNLPENVIAVTIVGDAKKFMVLAFPSFLDLKLRLKLVKIAITKNSVIVTKEYTFETVTVFPFLLIGSFPLEES